MGVIYHDGCKDIEAYKPCALEGIYRDWQRCEDIHRRLQATEGMVDEIGSFHKQGIESEQSAIAFFQTMPAYSRAMATSDTLMAEPTEDEVDAFFQANQLSDYGQLVLHLMYRHSMDSLPDHLEYLIWADLQA